MHRFNGDTARADCNSEDTYRKGNRAITILVILALTIFYRQLLVSSFDISSLSSATARYMQHAE